MEKNLKSRIIDWIREWFEQNGPKMNVVIGMSGGKDSTITAALLVEALGSGRVYGVALPQGNQGLNDADKICDYLGIDFTCINIGSTCDSLIKVLHNQIELSHNTILNIPARIRMTALYGFAQSVPGGAFVVNNCNYSEDYIGYATKFGDAAGDFSVLSDLTVTEILELGDELGLPREWVHKTPDDGLPGSCPDEEKFGFSYKTLDLYIRNGIEPDDLKIKEKIDKMHKFNLHKLLPMPKFKL